MEMSVSVSRRRDCNDDSGCRSINRPSISDHALALTLALWRFGWKDCLEVEACGVLLAYYPL